MEDFTIEWGGKEYTIPKNKIIPLICEVEQIISLGKLDDINKKQEMPLGLLTRAWWTILRAAGAKLEDHEVYEGMFKEGVSEGALKAVQGLIFLMVPASVIPRDEKEGAKKKENSKADSSSKKPT